MCVCARCAVTLFAAAVVVVVLQEVWPPLLCHIPKQPNRTNATTSAQRTKHIVRCERRHRFRDG